MRYSNDYSNETIYNCAVDFIKENDGFLNFEYKDGDDVKFELFNSKDCMPLNDELSNACTDNYREIINEVVLSYDDEFGDGMQIFRQIANNDNNMLMMLLCLKRWNEGLGDMIMEYLKKQEICRLRSSYN